MWNSRTLRAVHTQRTRRGSPARWPAARCAVMLRSMDSRALTWGRTGVGRGARWKGRHLGLVVAGWLHYPAMQAGGSARTLQRRLDQKPPKLTPTPPPMRRSES